MGKGETMQGAVASANNSKANMRSYARAASLGGESTKSSRSTASGTRRDDCCSKDTALYFLKRGALLLVSITVGVIFTTQRYGRAPCERAALGCVSISASFCWKMFGS